MAEILLSGTASGGSTVSAGHVYELNDGASGTSQLSGTVVLLREIHGHAFGGSSLAVWEPEKLEGYGRLTGTVQICRVQPIVHDAQRQRCFRWGHQLGPGDLEARVLSAAGSPLAPACIGFTVYQIQRGCAPKQIGSTGRKPGASGVGVYYATGTAGECGQPGLWMIRWCYRETFGAPLVYKDCYFWVLDSVLCPVAGDTLPRVRKWGWD